MGFNSAFKGLMPVPYSKFRNIYVNELGPLPPLQLTFPTNDHHIIPSSIPYRFNNNVAKFKVCKSVHHHTFQINQPTRCNNFSSLLLDVYSYIQPNMFRPRPTALLPPHCNGKTRDNWPDHDQQHCYHHAPTVKPEAATAFVELLMIGVRTPETC